MEFLKLDPDIDSDPTIMRAGWWGARFYELLLKVSGKKDLKGRIPPEYQDLKWLARIWNLAEEDCAVRDPAGTMCIARDAALGAGLMSVESDGSWLIRGWEKFYKPARPGKDRTRDWRDRQRLRDECDETPSRASEQSHGDARDECDATPLHTTHSTPPTPQKREETPAAHFPVKTEKPAKDDDLWDGMDFWAWAQAKRGEDGLATERRPNERTVGAWWSAVRMSGFSTKAMRLAFVAFGNDPYWSDKARAPPVPFGAFLKRWQDFARQEAA